MTRPGVENQTPRRLARAVLKVAAEAGVSGAADFKPIAHLYKSQVYQLAAYLGVPEEIQRRSPTTDTYSLEQSQEEFYFALPYDKMDLCLYGKDHGVSAKDLVSASGMSEDVVERVYNMIESKRKVAHYLHAHSLVID